MTAPVVRASWEEVWRSLTIFQQIAITELWSQGVHHGNKPTRERLRERGLLEGEALSPMGRELAQRFAERPRMLGIDPPAR